MKDLWITINQLILIPKSFFCCKILKIWKTLISKTSKRTQWKYNWPKYYYSIILMKKGKHVLPYTYFIYIIFSEGCFEYVLFHELITCFRKVFFMLMFIVIVKTYNQMKLATHQSEFFFNKNIKMGHF